MTAQNLTEAMLNFSPPNKQLADSVDVRQIVDLKSGAAFTRYQTELLKQQVGFASWSVSAHVNSLH